MTRNSNPTKDDSNVQGGTTLEMSEEAEGHSLERTDPNKDPESKSIRYEGMPTIRPVLVVLGLVLGGAILGIGTLWVMPALAGGPELADVFSSAIGILVAVISGRLIVKIVVLSRTKYTIRDDAFQREYELFHRSKSREIPVEKLRGHEFSQGRIQSLLGFGTVRLLTAGTNRSLGFIEFEHLNEPERVREIIRKISSQDD